MQLDVQILKSLNGLVATNGLWFHVVSAFGNNPLVRGAPGFICLAIVGLANPSIQIKSRIVLGFVATFLALMISVWCQTHVHLHLRPDFDASLHIHDVLGWSGIKQNWGARLYSMPSDTATAYFAIAAIVYLQDWKLGLLCLVWDVFTVGVCRVALGSHYPSDIVGAFILSFGMVYLLTNSKFDQRIAADVLQKIDPKGHLYNVFFLLFCAEAYTQFAGVEPAYFLLEKLLHGNLSWT